MLNWEEALMWSGGGGGGHLFNLAKTMVPVQNKVEMRKYKKLEVMQPMIKNKSELSAGK